MDFSYDAIYNLYNEFFTNTLLLDDLIKVLKVLAIAFFLLNVYTNMFSRIRTTMGNAQLPFDERKLFSSLAIVLLIIFYDKLLNFLDSLLLGMDSFYSHLSPLQFMPDEEPVEDESSIIGTNAYLKLASFEFLEILKDPSRIFLLLIQGVAWIIDVAIYIVFLLERFFFIGLLKVFGGIAIVMAVFEKFRDYFYKWIKLYVATYLLIFPFFLILGFSSFVYGFIDQTVEQNTPNKVVEFIIGDKISIVALCVMIWFKLKLFKKSNELVYKLFA